MKYFAKYFPVEGEIKPGDIILYKNKIGTQGEVAYAVSIEGETILLNTQDDIDSRKKIKLFLCNRDIQEGDKVVYKRGLATEFEVVKIDIVSDTIWLKRDEGNCQFTLSNFLPVNPDVIGEISPDATWVKEGDEFDEDEVKFIGFKYESCNSSALNEKEVQAIAERKGKQVLKVEHEDGDRDEHSRTVYTTIYWTQPDMVQIKGLCGRFH